MTSKTFRGSAAVPRKGLVKDHAAHMPGEWAHSRSRRQGLSKPNPKVGRRKTRRQKPSKTLLVLRFLLFGLLLLFVARHCVLALYDFTDLAHVLLLLRTSKTADVRPSAISNHRRALAEHFQAPRYRLRPLPSARSTRSLAVRVDTRRYSDSPIDIGSGADAAVVTGGIVKVEAMYTSGLKVTLR